MIRLYDRLFALLTAAAGIIIGAVFFVVIVDVGLRTLGFSPLRATSGLSEYALVYATMLAAPQLMREHGHIAVDSLLSVLPARPRRALAVSGVLLAFLIAAILAWLAVSASIDMAAAGEVDIRSIAIPKWLLYAPLALGFGLWAIEAARQLVTGRVSAERDTGSSL